MDHPVVRFLGGAVMTVVAVAALIVFAIVLGVLGDVFYVLSPLLLLWCAFGKHDR